MKIIVNEKNRTKIEAAIKEAEGRAKARTIKFYDIEYAIEKIEKRLGIPKAAMRGIRATVDVNAQHFPGAYRYRPESTFFTLERVSSGWAITNICRNYTAAPSAAYRLVLPEVTKEAVIKNMEVFDR